MYARIRERFFLILPGYGLVIDAKQCSFILLKNIRFGRPMTLKLDKQISTLRIKTLIYTLLIIKHNLDDYETRKL